MESKLEGTVNYIKFIDCIHDAVKQNEELKNRPPQYQEKAYLGLPIDQYTKKVKKTMTNSTSTHVTFVAAQCKKNNKSIGLSFYYFSR